MLHMIYKMVIKFFTWGDFEYCMGKLYVDFCDLIKLLVFPVLIDYCDFHIRVT